MKLKIPQILIGLVIVIIVVVGGFLLLHKSTTSTESSTTTSSSSSIVQTKTDATVGSYLANDQGLALYTYNKDTAGVSNCTGTCLTNWPAYTTTSTSTPLPANVGTIKRSDGSTQYTYNGLPLYTFTRDHQAGTVSGNNIDGFVVAIPVAASTPVTTTTPATATPYNY